LSDKYLGGMSEGSDDRGAPGLGDRRVCKSEGEFVGEIERGRIEVNIEGKDCILASFLVLVFWW